MRHLFTSLVLLLMPVAAQAQSPQIITLEGVTHYDSADLLSFAAQIAAQQTGQVAPADVAAIIEAIYLEDGYFLAEAWVGADGRTIMVDEGEIGTLQIEGVDASTFPLVRGLIAPVVGVRGVTQQAFERAIMLVEDIESISALAEIDYQGNSETANLRIIATAEDKSFGSATLDHPATFFGEAATLSFSQQYYSLFTPGDLARAELAFTGTFDGDETDQFLALTYRSPVGTSGAYAEFYGANVQVSRNATGALAATDIDGLTMIASLGYPVVRSVDSFGYAIVEARRSASDASVGGDDFGNAVNVFGASWIYSKALMNGGAVEYGVNASIGQTESEGGSLDGDETFAHLRFGLGYDAPLSSWGEGTALRAELYGQYSADNLPSIEHFLLGGKGKERGYATAEAGGDNGLSVTVELGRDYVLQGETIRLARPFTFIDAGYVQENSPLPGEDADLWLASVGLGVDMVLAEGFGATAYAALPLRDGAITAKQDAALYVSLTKEW